MATFGQQGHRPLNRVICFDCGQPTGAPMHVYRMMGPVDDQYRGDTFVHRNGQGCHKSMTASDVRDLTER